MNFVWGRYEAEKTVKDSFDLRMAVFVEEIGFSKEITYDENDKIALHIVEYEEKKPVCAARVLWEDEFTWHIGRLCAPAGERGKGYGKAMVGEILRKAGEENVPNVILGAKYDKKEFYESLGFTAYGDIFYEEDKLHIMMKKAFVIDRDLFDIPHHANLFALVYKSAVELRGEDGAKAADEGTKHYGQQRGARMAYRAKKDGQPLTMENYLVYGEWTDKNGRSKGYVSAKSPVYCLDNTMCGWCEAWKEAGLLEYGKHYCSYVDHNLVKGFNPELKLDILQVLSQGGETCAFRWNGFSLPDEEAEKAYTEKKAALGTKALKDFLYHTAHLYSRMKETFAGVFGDETAEKIMAKAINDYSAMYGKKMAYAVLEEAKQDFTKVEY